MIVEFITLIINHQSILSLWRWGAAHMVIREASKQHNSKRLLCLSDETGGEELQEGWGRRERFSELVIWCFKPSQPQGGEKERDVYTRFLWQYSWLNTGNTS